MTIIFAFILDFLLGEPAKHHPLVIFGDYSTRVEQRFYQTKRLSGFLAWCLAVLPVVFIFTVLDELFDESDVLSFCFSVVALYIAIGRRSLMEHAQAIFVPLQERESLMRQNAYNKEEAESLLNLARSKLAFIVSRDTSALGEDDITAAATESVLENGADAIFAAIFWFMVAGVPGLVLYRLSNTLDAMWGYKNDRYLQFGFFAAKFDDGLNYIPARLTAISYCLMAGVVQGSPRAAFACWQEQANQWKSPNAGAVMASGAGALQVNLGGAAVYHGQMQYRPVLGFSEDKARPLSAAIIAQSCVLVNASVLLWCVMAVLMD